SQVLTIDPRDPGTWLDAFEFNGTEQYYQKPFLGHTIEMMLDYQRYIVPRQGGRPLPLRPVSCGSEFTQAIQHFWSELGPDNTLPLVAHKLTLVRAYFETRAQAPLGGLIGTLQVR